MSRATITVLFTDIVGSTALRARLGEEAAEELRRAHDRLLAQTVESNGGRTVKGLGDGIMATFTGASDAVAAAVAIQQAIDRLGRSGKVPVPLAVRVGLSAGDVAFDDGDVHGTPVIEASRLCGAAGGGEILIADVVRILAGSMGGHDYVSVGPLELKGLDHPVGALRVDWKPAAASTIPMPAFLTDVGRIFVGRDAEVERIGQLWKEALSGERRVALLGGEPGVGKTRLAAQVAVEVHEEGGVVLAGRCDEDLGVPYQPFVEALRHYVDHTSSAELTERLGRYGGELVRLMPELADRVADLPPALQSDPETERYRLFEAVGAWLAAASAAQPVLLVVDDLHWAAKPTLLLLRHVLRFSEPLRVLILGTYRDTELGRRHPLSEFLADLRRQGGVERVSLSGLDAGAVARFVEEMAGHDLAAEDEAFARAIYAETEGNPFFVGEVLRHLAETGAVERRQGRWVTTTAIEELGIPEGIRDVVGRRLSRLSDEANDVLAVAAVIGADFELAVLSPASGLSENAVVAALDEAMAARLVSETPESANQYRFAHALVRATLDEELSAARRVALHRQAAEAIESVHATRLQEYLPALAHHYAQSAVPAADPAKAVDYARRAGDAALAQFAHDDAVRYYSQALDLLRLSKALDDDPQIELLIALGEAQRRAGYPAHRETLLEAARLARRRHDADALARAALANCRGSLTSNAGRIDFERIEALQAALELVGEADSPIRARLMAHVALEQSWTGDRAELARLTGDAISLARRLADPATLADVLLTSFYAIWNPATVHQRLDHTEELFALAEELGDQHIAVHAYFHRARAAMEKGDLTETRRCAEGLASLAADIGEPTLRWMAEVTAFGLPLAAGQIAEAEQRAVAAFAMAQDVQPDAQTYLAGQMFLVRYEQGRLEELLPSVLEFVADPEFRAPFAEAMTAFMYCELDRVDDSRQYYTPMAADRFIAIRFDHVWLLAHACFAEVAVRLGDSESAAVLSDLLAPYHDQVVAMHCWPLNCVSHYLGLLATSLGRFDEAEAHFQATVNEQLRLSTPAWLVHTRFEWARMLLARGAPGDVEQARELLSQALATARELGLANVERRTVALIEDCP